MRISDQAFNDLALYVPGRPLKEGAPVQGPGEGPSKDAQAGGKAWPSLASGSPYEWLHDSHPKQQDSPVSGWDRFFWNLLIRELHFWYLWSQRHKNL